MMTITVIGAGYVGLVTATLLANAMHTVYCIETNPGKYSKLSRGICYFHEKNLQEELTTAIISERIHFLQSSAEAIAASEAVFLCLPTPSSPYMIADLSALYTVLDEIIPHMRPNTVLVLKSTVPVGTSLRIKELLEKKAKHEVHLVMNPEFLRQGNAVYDFKNPFLVVVGGDRQVATIMEEIYANVVKAPYLYVSITDAEMIKYASNLFLASRISLINELAQLCEKTGANVLNVQKALGSDPNIGKHYLSAGIGYGGSCFTKDLEALIRMGQAVIIHMPLIEAVQSVNNRQRYMLVEKITRRFGKNLNGRRFAVWGLTFKPETSDMRGAPSIDIINNLIMLGADIVAYDPSQEYIKENLETLFSVQYAENPYEALAKADALLLLTEWSVFKEIDYRRCNKELKNPIVFDGRNILDRNAARKAGIELIQIGVPE